MLRDKINTLQSQSIQMTFTACLDVGMIQWKDCKKENGIVDTLHYHNLMSMIIVLGTGSILENEYKDAIDTCAFDCNHNHMRQATMWK
jgi:hypothetical protein